MNHDEIIHRFLDGLASPEEAATLSKLLETDADARLRYLNLAELHAALAADETLRASLPAAMPARPASSSWVRSLAQLAAGVVIGALTVGAVWAYAIPRGPSVRELALVNAGFESDAAPKIGDVPVVIGEWSGDPRDIVSGFGAVKARSGQHMVRFRAARPGGDFEGSKPMASDVWQVLALPGGGPCTMKIRAWFNAATEKQARFHLMAIAGAGDAASAPALWAQRYSDASAALASCRAMIFVDRDPATWEPGEVTLQVPAEARTLIVGLAAYRVPVAPPHEWFPAQFADDVSVTIQEAQP
jgi:hypothetical protein